MVDAAIGGGSAMASYNAQPPTCMDYRFDVGNREWLSISAVLDCKDCLLAPHTPLAEPRKWVGWILLEPYAIIRSGLVLARLTILLVILIPDIRDGSCMIVQTNSRDLPSRLNLGDMKGTFNKKPCSKYRWGFGGSKLVAWLGVHSVITIIL